MVVRHRLELQRSNTLNYRSPLDLVEPLSKQYNNFLTISLHHITGAGRRVSLSRKVFKGRKVPTTGPKFLQWSFWAFRIYWKQYVRSGAGVRPVIRKDSSPRPQGVLTDVVGLRHGTAETIRPVAQNDLYATLPRETLKRSSVPRGKPIDGAHTSAGMWEIDLVHQQNRDYHRLHRAIPGLYQFSPQLSTHGAGRRRQHAIQHGRPRTVLRSRYRNRTRPQSSACTRLHGCNNRSSPECRSSIKTTGKGP